MNAIINQPKHVRGNGKSGAVSITRFATSIAQEATAIVDQVPVSITPHDLWMTHIENTSNRSLRDIIVALVSKIVPENTRNSTVPMLEILETHNYGVIQKILKALDPIVDKDVIEMLRLANNSQFQEDRFIDEIAKYISEAMQHLQYALVRISQ